MGAGASFKGEFSNEEIHSIIRDLAPFRELPANVLANIEKEIEVKHYASPCRIIEQGHEIQLFGVVAKGQLNITARNQTGQEIVICSQGQGYEI